MADQSKEAVRCRIQVPVPIKARDQCNGPRHDRAGQEVEALCRRGYCSKSNRTLAIRTARSRSGPTYPTFARSHGPFAHVRGLSNAKGSFPTAPSKPIEPLDWLWLTQASAKPHRLHPSSETSGAPPPSGSSVTASACRLNIAPPASGRRSSIKPQNAAKQVARHGDFGHLEHRVAGVSNDLCANLHHLLAQRLSSTTAQNGSKPASDVTLGPWNSSFRRGSNVTRRTASLSSPAAPSISGPADAHLLP